MANSSISEAVEFGSGIKAIIFDLSEVFLHGLLGMRDDLASRLHVPVEAIDFRVTELNDLFEGRIQEDAYWNSFLRKEGWNIDPLELKQMVRANFREIKGTREIILDLRKLGYMVGLFSVHAKEWIHYCEERFQYKDLFDLRIYSFEIEVCKPEKRAFEILVERTGLSSNQILFIDDAQTNIDTAMGMGIHSILFESPKQLAKQLKSLGILK